MRICIEFFLYIVILMINLFFSKLKLHVPATQLYLFQLINHTKYSNVNDVFFIN